MLGCKSVQRNQIPLCQLKFDFSDDKLIELNLHNKRTIKNFTEYCEK